ncbi:hypothetical protein DM860_002172 [Cuscuta australis]|uniref:MORF/ORRM1/DAG-like MORF domain-containing protein n=1 Tax=Cuscuta australis TaxID=267555 RepID=A0A328E0C3_9ASTE|nr:hypothetical protein DM860_002172 [Cuscuta australis]
MATGVLARFLFSAGKQATSTASARSVSSLPSCGNFLYLSSLLRHRPLASSIRSLYAARRGFVTCNSVNFARWTRFRPPQDPSPMFSDLPSKESILLPGCDFEHWLVVVEKPEGNPTRDEIIDSYIKLLARVVGSEEEARMRIYSVSTRCYYTFGAFVPEELSYKLKELDFQMPTRILKKKIMEGSLL